MTMRKLSFVLFVLSFFIVGLLGTANGVSAETLKFKLTNVVTKGESFPLENIEGSYIAWLVRDGAFVLENGEVGTMRGVFTAESTVGRGGSFSGFLMFVFGDGSTILGSLQSATYWPDPEKKVLAIQKASGELIKGSGRFKGIKGTQSMTGSLLKPLKGETFPKAYNEFVLTYTVSP
jgi:hypothetical protein